MRLRHIAGALALVATGALADVGHLVTWEVNNYVGSVSKAFYRAMSRLDANGLQPSALTLTDPFVTELFRPAPNTSMAWSITGISPDQSRLCLTYTANKKEAWQAAVFAMSRYKLRPANPDCSPAAQWGIPAAFPVTVVGTMTLDRRAVITQTTLPSTGVISPAQEGSNIQLGNNTLVIPSGGYLDIIIRNPGLTSLCPPPPNAGLPLDWCVNKPSYDKKASQSTSWGVYAVKTRPGFTYEHSCGTIPAGGTCVVRIRCVATEEDYRVGFVRIEFTDGTWANISLIGTR